MAKGRLIGIRMDAIEAKRVELRAQSLGFSLSAYIRSLIEADLKKGGQADALAQINTEVSFVTGFLVRKLIDHVFTEDGGKKIQQAANEQAESLIASLIQKDQKAK